MDGSGPKTHTKSQKVWCFSLGSCATDRTCDAGAIKQSTSQCDRAVHPHGYATEDNHRIRNVYILYASNQEGVCSQRAELTFLTAQRAAPLGCSISLQQGSIVPTWPFSCWQSKDAGVDWVISVSAASIRTCSSL